MKKQKFARITGYRSWLECRNVSYDMLEYGYTRIGWKRGFCMFRPDVGTVILFVLP